MKVKVSDYIVNRLVEIGTSVFFGYQGGNISHMIDSIGKHPKAQFVQTCHEQAAAYAANSFAQINEGVGVALASSGPGAINMINGIANAFCDSIPCIFFSGDVNTTAKKTDGSSRQNAFQEIDIISLVIPITKYAVSIGSPNDIIEELEKSIKIAISKRPGPVLINLPHDIQRSVIEVDNLANSVEIKKDDNAFYYARKALSVIEGSQRPVFLVGGGMRGNSKKELFKEILDKLHIPVVCSLLGIDDIRHDHDCYRGVIGDYGSYGANRILKESDCIIVLGSRLDDRQISRATADGFYISRKHIIHVDIDPHELSNKIVESLAIECDLLDFLIEFKDMLPISSDYRLWLNDSKTIIEETDQFANHFFHPNSFIRDLSKTCEAVYTLDVGNNQMHSMQSLFVNGKTRVLSSGGLGSMGYSLPAAVGACFAKGVVKVNAICGDGGIQMNIQELGTITYYNLPINVLLLNNSGLGMIYDLQEKLFQGRHFGTTENYCLPNFESIAKAYGFTYVKVQGLEDYKKAIEAMKNKTRMFIEFVYKIGTSLSMKE